jgi:uncharacterized membrane protein
MLGERNTVATVAIVMIMLLLPASVGANIGRRTRHSDPLRLGAVVGLSVSFAFFSYGHFAMTNELVEMLPAWVPGHTAIILITGAFEILIAVGLLLPPTRRAVGLVAAAVLLLFFPANVYASLRNVGPGGHQTGPEYLIVRAPLQLVLLLWTYYFVLREPKQG